MIGMRDERRMHSVPRSPKKKDGLMPGSDSRNNDAEEERVKAVTRVSDREYGVSGEKRARGSHTHREEEKKSQTSLPSNKKAKRSEKRLE